MIEAFSYPFVQRALLEVLLLAVAAGILGAWVVLRGLAFFTHAIGHASFPGLVLADGLGLPAPICALVVAVLFAAGLDRLTRARAGAYDVITALLLIGALAVGVILASNVFHSSADIDTLLFGSLLLVSPADLLLAAAAALLAVLGTRWLGAAWLTAGFDPDSARQLGLRSSVPDLVLLLLISITAVTALSAIGALLVASLFVIPAATVRLWSRRLRSLQLGSIILVAIEGVAGLWLSFGLNAPPGATIALLAGAVFAAAAILRPRFARPLPRRPASS